MKGRLLVALPLFAIGCIAALMALGCTWEMIRVRIDEYRIGGDPTPGTTHLLIIGERTIACEPWQFALAAAGIASLCLVSGRLLLDRDERDRT
jgi:hypothetical protein